LEYLSGKSTLDEAINILKKETRHYAKRQITWFKREKDVIWINKDYYMDDDEILACMLENINEKGLS
ncbi:MAG TPA: tRNA (adenosine(37)-N6)-dimethylallyltransferase MiaA, partial [Clostridiales bacterium]|nr:tRNA (adenosine(37)-N6)-dimethylallyltransferase MiaA [Clostridiales bacterium]